MNVKGIYTLANDVVWDQLIALLNSIEHNVSSDIPVCIIPYDNRLEKVKREIDRRSNVSLFENQESLEKWSDFAHQIAKIHPAAIKTNLSHPRWTEGRLHRKLAAFDGLFNKFVFYDGDSLAMKPLDKVFEKLDKYDFVFDDWEHKKPESVAALNLSLIEKNSSYKKEEVRTKLHCSSFFGSKKGLFDRQELSILLKRLTEDKEVEWINGNGWWDDAFLLNYLTLRCDRPIYNFTLSSNPQDRTGNCADADPFVNVDNILYNQQGLKPIHRIHYMNYSSQDFARLSQGEDVNIRYKEEFLYYRFWKNLEDKPTVLRQPNLMTKLNRKLQKSIKKISSIF